MAKAKPTPTPTYIIPDLHPLIIQIDSITPDPNNAIDHTDYDLGHTGASLAKYGQRVPIVINRKNNVIEAGEGRWRAAQNLGWEYIAAVGIDDDEATAIGFGIADNATGRIAQFNPKRVLELLKAFNDPSEVAGIDDGFMAEMNQRLETQFDDDDFGDGGEAGEKSDGSLLKLVNVTLDDPKHVVEKGDVWDVGHHILVCCDVLLDWNIYMPFLNDGDIFAPYVGVFVPLSKRAEKERLVMVQPSPYIAGHLLDRFAEQGGKVLKH